MAKGVDVYGKPFSTRSLVQIAQLDAFLKERNRARGKAEGGVLC